MMYFDTIVDFMSYELWLEHREYKTEYKEMMSLT